MSLPAEKSANSTVIKINDDNLLKAVTIGSIVLSLLTSITALIFSTRAVAYGIAAGSAIAIINFVWQRTVMQRILGLQHGRPVAFAQIRYLLRLTLSALALYLILTSKLFSLPGLLVGLSVVVITIVCATVFIAIQHKGD